MHLPRPIVIATLACLAASPALGGMGPCKPIDGNDGLFCGTGKGSARVIDDSVSPDGKLALAWRDPDDVPTEQPGTDDLELMVVRLADGAMLAKTATAYWHAGNAGRVNRLQERAAWSRDSRMVVRAFHSRFDTDNLDLFVLAPQQDRLIGQVDLRAIVLPALQARLKKRIANFEDWSFSVASETIKVGNNGAIRLHAMVWKPKDGPEHNFRITLQADRGKNGVTARIVAIAPGPQ